MKEKIINLKGDVQSMLDLVSAATKAGNGIIIKVNHYFIDAASVPGVFTLDPCANWNISYPEEDIEFEEFINKFEI